MPMKVIFSGEFPVYYSMFSVETDGDYFEWDVKLATAGQSNGLCGAAIPGGVVLITGMHTGSVGLVIEAHDSPPPVDDQWEEIIEVGFTPSGDTFSLADWNGDRQPLDMPRVPYRIRYSASGMDAGNKDGLESDLVLDHYLLQFWPATETSDESDRLIKQTSRIAAYWHGVAAA